MQNLYYFILQYSPVIPLVYGAIHFRKLNRPVRILFAWLAFSLSLTIIMTILAKQGIHNLWVMNLSLPVYVFLLMWMFSSWETNPEAVLVLRALIILFALIWIWEIVLVSSLFEFTTYSRPVMDVIIVTVCCFAIYQDTIDTEIPLIDRPRFWISAGLMLYYGGTLLLNLFSKILLEKSNDALQKALLVQPALSLVSHLLYTMGLRSQCRK